MGVEKGQPGSDESGLALKDKSRKHPPVTQLLRNLQGFVLVEKKSYTLFWPEMARLYPLNQIFALLQSQRRGMLFAYKKACHALIERTLAGVVLPEIEPPIKIFLYRRAPREVDQDALASMFKYLIDGLRDVGAIVNDDPRYIRPSEPYQERGKAGEYALGMHIEHAPPVMRWPWIAAAETEALRLKLDSPSNPIILGSARQQAYEGLNKIPKAKVFQKANHLGLSSKPKKAIIEHVDIQTARQLIAQRSTSKRKKERWTEEDVRILQESRRKS